MNGLWERLTGRSGGTPPSRRRLLATAVAAPVLAGTEASAAWAGVRHGAHPGEPAEPAEPVEPVPTSDADWADVARELGRAGEMKGELMYRVQYPRGDLRIVTRGVTVAPALLGLQLGFVRYADGHTMLMGDMAVTESELQPVTRALQTHGIAQTAIHKHLLGQTPEMWWVHIHAHHPDPGRLARQLRPAIEATGAPPPAPPTTPAPLELDTAGIDAALGARGFAGDGVYQCTFIRSETIVDGGRVLPPGLGSTSALNFQDLGGGRAALVGDFVMTAGEVQEVLSRLSRGGIDVITLHNHSLSDQTGLFFVHTWAVGDGVRIARALRPAVDATNVTPSG